MGKSSGQWENGLQSEDIRLAGKRWKHGTKKDLTAKEVLQKDGASDEAMLVRWQQMLGEAALGEAAGRRRSAGTGKSWRLAEPGEEDLMRVARAVATRRLETSRSAMMVAIFLQTEAVASASGVAVVVIVVILVVVVLVRSLGNSAVGRFGRNNTLRQFQMNWTVGKDMSDASTCDAGCCADNLHLCQMHLLAARHMHDAAMTGCICICNA
jgi:hypothetical protein